MKIKPRAGKKERKTIELLENNKDIDLEIVTLADKLSNLRSIYKDYKILGEDLWKKFNVKEKGKHAWYYKSIGENIKQLNDSREYGEYVELLEVFN